VKSLRIVAVALALASMVHAIDTMEELRAKLEHSTGGNKAKFALEIADRQIEQANAEFTAGNTEKGQALIKEVADLVEVAGEAAIGANKRVKDTEISTRKLERRMEDIHRTVAFEDQDQIDESLKRIGVVRNKLLDRMFNLDEDLKSKKKK
jgi:hypothetical protein